jgi:K+-sensing histidine kinase KdpD
MNHSRDCTVLVVDDEVKNRKLLSEMLQAKGYNVLEAGNGEDALTLVNEQNPDVLLLDVMMPDMSGYEVCSQVKADPQTAMIPVIMVTALNDYEDLVRGVEAGALDFLTKPVKMQEILLKVRNASFMKKLYEREHESREEIQGLKDYHDDLVRMVVHDMKNPLFLIDGYVEMLQEHLKSQNDDVAERYIDSIKQSSGQLLKLVRNMLDIGRMEYGGMTLKRQECDLGGLIQEVRDAQSSIYTHIHIVSELPEVPVKVLVDIDLINRVITNILENALNHSADGDTVTISMQQDDDRVTIEIKDQGDGIPEEYQESIFDKFSCVDQKREGRCCSTGLGLTFCRLAIHEHDGRIGVSSEQKNGSAFWFTLPSL